MSQLFLHNVGENRLLTPCNCRLRAVSLFSWSVEQNARDAQITTRVTRACTPLTKSEEKERMLVVYCNCQSNGSDRFRDDCSHLSSFRTTPHYLSWTPGTEEQATLSPVRVIFLRRNRPTRVKFR